MRRERCADARIASGEAAQVQALRHRGPVVDRIVVPADRLAAHALRDIVEMARRDLARADLLAGPEDADPRVERGRERLEVARRAPTEDAIEQGIVAVVAGADADARGAGPGRGELHDRGLAR